MVGSLSLIQGIFPIQGLNPGLLHGGWILYQLSYQGSLRMWGWVAYLFSRGSSWPTSLVAQMVKHLPTMWETRFYPWVGKILQRRKWQPTPVFILAWKIPWEEPGRLQSMGSQRVHGVTRLSDFTYFPTEEWNQGLLHCREILYQLSYQGSKNSDNCSLFPPAA